MHLGLASLLLAALAVPSPIPALASSTSAPAALPLSSVAIAPDGHTLAWVSGSHAESQLHVAPLPAGSPEHTISPTSATPGSAAPGSPASPCPATNPVWSPDSTTLAFTSTCGSPQDKAAQEQIFLYTPATGATRQLTHLTGNIEELAFAPDGRTLAFLFVENATRSAGALDAMKPPSGVIGEDGVEIQRVGAVSLDSGQLTQLTPATLHVYEFSWSPDSHSLTYIAANPPGENNWWVARLYTQTAQLGAAPTVLLDPTQVAGPLHNLQIAVPRWSPDGHSIALIGGLMSDQGSTGGDIYLVPATGGPARNLTPHRPSTPTWLAWLPPPSPPTPCSSQRTPRPPPTSSGSTPQPAPSPPTSSCATPARCTPAASRMPSPSPRPERSPPSAPPSPTRRRSSPASPRSSAQLPTSTRPCAAPARAPSPSSGPTEGFHVQGWLTFPSHFDASRHYPLIVSVHGGPSASIRSTWGQQSVYSDAGYFVLQPNPRGSFGQGERFTEANRKDFGYGDLRDILAGLDTVEHKFPVDPHREGLGGWSYGGFMTMFAVTQTHRFAAAVAGAGIADWQSYYGENSIDQWMTPFFGDSVYNDPAVYARSSAINFIKQVSTPTLVIVGDRDGECPAPQSFEFWHALRAEGVPTQLVIYPAEGHRFKDPDHIADRTRRELAWFAKYMPAKYMPASSTPASSTPAQSTAQNTTGQN